MDLNPGHEVVLPDSLLILGYKSFIDPGARLEEHTHSLQLTIIFPKAFFIIFESKSYSFI